MYPFMNSHTQGIHGNRPIHTPFPPHQHVLPGFPPADFFPGYGNQMYGSWPGNHHAGGGHPTQFTGTAVGAKLFYDPLQSKEEAGPIHHGFQGMFPAYMPKHAQPIKPPGAFGSLMNSFKTENGTLDLNKMVNTAGQMASAITQVTNMAKNLGGIFKA